MATSLLSRKVNLRGKSALQNTTTNPALSVESNLHKIEKDHFFLGPKSFTFAAQCEGKTSNNVYNNVLC